MTVIRITSERNVKEIQEEFNGVFPFLKIEFFRKTLQSRQYTNKEHSLPQQQVIGDVYSVYKKEEMCITPSMTVKELEKTCEEKFGIQIHIYRKAVRNIWIETTMTDNWTIKQQNDNGCKIFSEISSH